MPLRSFGKYEVLARLASGGAASIFLARQSGAAGFHRLVCLKTLLPERARDEDFVAMFLDEARLAARLSHPHCVQIHDLGRVRGVYYISMEYILGETLWNLLTTVTRLREPLPAAHVAHIIASVCDGLHHAHELTDPRGRPYQLVHRDVSPQNIMISFEGQTKVLDFGIAKAETGRAPTMAGIVKGKFSYMSPEQITGSKVDRRSDLFSLGVVMFECLASRRLYRADSPEEVAKLILEHRAPRLRDVVPDAPLALDEVCHRALARPPKKRFQTAQEMGDALRAYLGDVRHHQTASSLSVLLAQRFEGTVDDRRAGHDAALTDPVDEQRILRALDAQPVRDIDLFPDDSGPEGDDFTETGVRVPIPGDGPARVAEGAGWRVELDSAHASPSPVPDVSRPVPALHPSAAYAETEPTAESIGKSPGSARATLADRLDELEALEKSAGWDGDAQETMDAAAEGSETTQPPKVVVDNAMERTPPTPTPVAARAVSVSSPPLVAEPSPVSAVAGQQGRRYGLPVVLLAAAVGVLLGLFVGLLWAGTANAPPAPDRVVDLP